MIYPNWKLLMVNSLNSFKSVLHFVNLCEPPTHYALSLLERRRSSQRHFRGGFTNASLVSGQSLSGDNFHTHTHTHTHLLTLLPHCLEKNLSVAPA